MTNRNRPLFAVLAIGCLCSGAARAQSQTSDVAQPSSPAPAVVSTGTPSTSAPAVMQAPAANPAAPTNVGQIVYTPRLPEAAELTNAAAAQGLTVERIVQTSHQVIAFYRNASGQTSSVAYQSLPPTGPSPAPATVAPNVVVTAPPPTVVYQEAPRVVYQTAPRVVYYDYPSYYYPRTYYPPVSFSFGLGYNRGFYHGGHRHHHYRHR